MEKHVETARDCDPSAGSGTFASLLSPLAHPTLLWEPAERRSMRREFGNFSVAMRNSALAPSLVTTSMPCHRPGQFAVIGRRAGRHPAMPLRHALIEHDIGRHPNLGVRILAADLLHRSRVVVGLPRTLRKRGGACAHEDDRRETTSRQRSISQRAPEQDVDALGCGLLRTPVDLLLGQGAHVPLLTLCDL